MKRLFALAALLTVGACDKPVEPPPAGVPIVGYYRLLSINNSPLPYSAAPGTSTTGGGLSIGVDSGWTVGDTTIGTVPEHFRWGGVVVSVAGLPTRFTFHDSSLTETRYVGTISMDGETFALEAAPYTYRFKRVPQE
jgi:hypothetical protein